ncbi:hypothetical protein EGT51_03515 [Levilactobacillus suantsaiihabitans]|uniref:Uncharacterized protein n=1 Tax=Levilactobacillus suantsaiihabitans TaxID=2487722 RepID=A0A4Z0JDZ0_9LACO|nr:hypothetical protein EGT51_03515 [Levilactobacillus suantsaiihabitans]
MAETCANLPEAAKVEPAVSTVLAEVFSQPTPWDDLEDWRFVSGLQASRKTVPQAAGVPQSRRNLG